MIKMFNPNGSSMKICYAILFCIFGLVFLWACYFRAHSLMLIGHEFASLEFAGYNVTSAHMVEANGWLYYTCVLKPCICLFGVTPLTARLPSIVSGLASLFLLAWLIGKLAGPRAAAIASLLFVIHPSILEFSTHCRFYAFNSCACLLSTCLFWSWMNMCSMSIPGRNMGRHTALIAYLLSCIVCVLSQVSSVMLFPAHWIICFCAVKDKKAACLLTLSSAFLLGLCLFILAGYDPFAASRVGDYPPVTFPYTASIFAILLGASGNLIFHQEGFLGTPAVYIFFPLLCLLWGGVSAVRTSRNKPESRKVGARPADKSGTKTIEASIVTARSDTYWLGPLLLLCAFIPIAGVLLISILYVNVFDDPIIYYIIPYLCIIMGLGIEKMPRWLGLAAIVAWGLLLPVFRVQDYKQQNKTSQNDWRIPEVVEFFESNSPLKEKVKADMPLRSDASDGRVFTDNSSEPLDNTDYPYAQARVWFYGPEQTFVQTWIIEDN